MRGTLVVADFAGASGYDFADEVVALVGAVEDGFGFFDVLGRDDCDEADAHVEGAEHFFLLHVAELLEVSEERGDFPGAEVDVGVEAFGEDAGEILGDAAAGDVGHALDESSGGGSVGRIEWGGAGGGELADNGKIGAVGAHEGGAGLVLEVVDVLLGTVFGDFEEELAGERIAVGVEAVRGQAEEAVAGLDAFAGDDARARNGADDSASEVVFAVGVEAGHLGGFAADEGAAVRPAGFGDAADDGFDDLVFDAAGGEVIEKKEGGGALDGDVVDAVIDEVGADGVVDA